MLVVRILRKEPFLEPERLALLQFHQTHPSDFHD